MNQTKKPKIDKKALKKSIKDKQKAIQNDKIITK